MGGDMTATLQSPFGPISLRDDGQRITALDWQPGQGAATALQAEGLRQLAEQGFDPLAEEVVPVSYTHLTLPTNREV